MKMHMTTSYSKQANPRRGYHDYEVIINFETGEDGSSLTEEGQKRYVSHIAQLFKDNMWCHGPTKVGDNMWKINYGYDSGD